MRIRARISTHPSQEAGSVSLDSRKRCRKNCLVPGSWEVKGCTAHGRTDGRDASDSSSEHKAIPQPSLDTLSDTDPGRPPNLLTGLLVGHRPSLPIKVLGVTWCLTLHQHHPWDACPWPPPPPNPACLPTAVSQEVSPCPSSSSHTPHAPPRVIREFLQGSLGPRNSPASAGRLWPTPCHLAGSGHWSSAAHAVSTEARLIFTKCGPITEEQQRKSLKPKGAANGP